MRGLRSRALPVMSELELGINNAVSGGGGGRNERKDPRRRRWWRGSWNAGQRRVLVAGQQRDRSAGHRNESREQDFVVVEAGFGQLEGTDHFRPAVAVLLNLAPTLPPRYLAKVRVDTMRGAAVCQPAMFRLGGGAERSAGGVAGGGDGAASKVITFSASNRGRICGMTGGCCRAGWRGGPGRCWTWRNAGCRGRTRRRI
jgi:hypothetical protein